MSMKNTIKAMYESPQSEIFELTLRGSIADTQIIVASNGQGGNGMNEAFPGGSTNW